MTNTDLARVINSDEIQSVLRPKLPQIQFTTRKKNPLRNFGALVKLNPYALTQRRRIILQSQKSHEKRRAKVQTVRARKAFKEHLFGPMAILPVEAKKEEENFEEFVYEGPITTYEESEEEEVKTEEKEGDDKKEDDKKGKDDEKGKKGKDDDKGKGKGKGKG